MTITKQEQDDNDKKISCPPGMTPQDGKCVKAGAESRTNTEETNAGDVNDKGATTNVDSSTKDNPSNTHDCPPGSTWTGDQCEPSGDPAGQVGGGGAGASETPGKESLEQFYKMHERLMSGHTAYNDERLEAFKEYNTGLLNQLSAKMGLPQYKPESAAYGVKTEASSYVDDTSAKSIYQNTVAGPAAFFEACNNKPGSNATHPDLKSGYTEWFIRPEGYFATLQKGWLNYGNNQAHGKLETEQKSNSEAFTISGGDMPQIFSKQVYLVPGGRMRVPIRQFLDTKIIESADRHNWYKVNGFAFDDVTNEGSEPTTEEAQTITKVTATPALVRANQTVRYSDIENAPFDLIEAFNRAAALGALDAEATDVLDTVYNAITPTNWVEANGGIITEDDTTAPGTAQQEMIYAGMRLIQDQGGDTSPGNMVAFLHPKALQELILDTTAEFWTKSEGSTTALHSTALGVLENRLGTDIVATNAVAAEDNTTNDTYRNILAMKGSIGLAVAAELQIEAQRRPDLSAVKVGARHRIKGAIIDETMTARMSTTQ